MADAEELLEDIGQMEARIVIEELLENQTREQLLLQEAQGKYPEWNKMSDERLMKALHTLRDEERKLIYQHVFEERTFEEMKQAKRVIRGAMQGYLLLCNPEDPQGDGR